MRIRMIDLVVGYGHRPILQPLTCDIRHGSSCLVIGPNGAGKSTLLRTIVGLQPALGGTVLVEDEIVTFGSLPKLLSAGVRFLGQGDRGFRLLRVAQQRQVLSRLLRFHAYSAACGTQNVNRRVGSMSVGERRLEAIRLLDCECGQLFVLDEPTAGLDQKNRLAIKDWMKDAIEHGKSFVVVEHDYHFFSGVFDKMMIVRSPEVVYFGDALPVDQIIRLSS